MKDLDAIMAGRDEPVSVESTKPAEESSESGKARDDQGRFAAREQPQENPNPAEVRTEDNTEPKTEGEGAPKPAPEVAKPGFVPVQARDAERQRRREAEQRATELERRLQALETGRASQGQPQPQAQEDALTALLANPEAYFEKLVSAHLAPVQQKLSSYEEKASERDATRDHGQEAVDAAKEAALEAQELGGPAYELMISRLKGSEHPFDELVKWHREQGALQKYGTDPEAYINAEIERRLAERQPEQQPAPSAHPQQLPSSFAAARSSGPRSGPAPGGPRTLSEIMPR